MERDLRVLLVEDTEDDAVLLTRELRRSGFNPDITRVETAAQLHRMLEIRDWDVVISDHNMPGFSSEGVLRAVQESGLDVPVIIVSGTIGEAVAVSAMKTGASDYVMKDNLARLGPAIERELREAEVRREHRRAEATIHHLAYHDSLTGLANRHHFEVRLKEALEDARERGTAHALLYIDLDQFKVVNDTCGHGAGDELLRQLGLLLQGQVRQNDLLGRLGGDEFGLLLASCPVQRAQSIGAGILQAINDFRFSWSGKSFAVGASIGLVPIDGHSATETELLAAADIACYAAKDLGRNRIHIYDRDDCELLRRKGEMHWVSRIREALEQDRFVLYWQSIVPLAGYPGVPKGSEVLLRLRDEDGALVAPGAFLPAAERYNLASAVDRWVVRALLDHLASPGCAQTTSHPVVFVNISGATLNDDGFFSFLREELRRTGVPPSRLCFEITETAAVANLSRAVTFIRGVRGDGCRFALDDFGAGLSSFSYLKTIPVDFLKIDGGFVRDMTEDPMDRAIVEAIAHIGQAVGLKTIAEFVETKAVLQSLVNVGVNWAQGYAIHRPEPLVSGVCC